MVEQLSKEQIRALLEFCLQNADELTDEADILLQAGKYARATALCIIAMEELGKRTTLWRAITFAEDESEWKAFWRRFRRHDVKIGNVMMGHYYVTNDPERFEELRELAVRGQQAFTGAREYALYVDMLQGKPHLPSASFTKNKAEVALQSVCEHLVIHRALYPTDARLEFAEKLGNRKKCETLRQWVKRVFVKDIPLALEKMVDEYDKVEQKD